MGCCDSKVNPNPKNELNDILPNTNSASKLQGEGAKYDGEIDGWSEHLSDDPLALSNAEVTIQKDGKTYAKYWYFKGDSEKPPVSSYAMPEPFLRHKFADSAPPLPAMAKAAHENHQATVEVGKSAANREHSATVDVGTAASGDPASTTIDTPSAGVPSPARHEELIKQPLSAAGSGKMKLAPIAQQPGAVPVALLGSDLALSPLKILTPTEGEAVKDPGADAAKEAARLNNLREEAIRREKDDSENKALISIQVKFTGVIQDGQLSKYEQPTTYRFYVKRPNGSRIDTGAAVSDLLEMICKDFGFTVDQLKLFHQGFECTKSETIASVIGAACIDPVESSTVPVPMMDLYVAGTPESPPEYVFKPSVTVEQDNAASFDGRDWCREAARIQLQTEQAVTFKDMAGRIDSERKMQELLTAFTQTAKEEALHLVNEAEQCMTAAGAAAPWYHLPSSSRTFVRQGVVLQEVRDWYMVQSKSERVSVKAVGKRLRKGKDDSGGGSSVALLDEAGILASLELQGLQAVRDCGIEGLAVPPCALVEHCGVRFIAMAAVPEPRQLVYGSDTQGLVVEDGASDDEAVVKARALSSAMNLRAHSVKARLTGRKLTVALPLHSQLYRVGGAPSGSTGESGGTGGEAATYFFCGGWRLFPREVDVDGELLPMWRRLTPAAFQKYGHKNQLADGWTLLTSKEPVKCCESGEWITDLEYYRYERRDYAVCMAEYERRVDDDNFRVPRNKLALYKVPRGLQREYYKNFGSGAETEQMPIKLTPLNPDWCESADEQGKEEVRQLVCHLLPCADPATAATSLEEQSMSGNGRKSARETREMEAAAAKAAKAALAMGAVERGTGEVLVDLVEDLLPVNIEPDSDDDDDEDNALEEAELSVSSGEELAIEMQARGLNMQCLGALFTHLTAQMRPRSSDPAGDGEDAQGRVVPAHLIEICLREIVSRSMQATVLALLRNGKQLGGEKGEGAEAQKQDGPAAPKFTSQAYLSKTMCKYINLLLEPEETYEGVKRSDASAALWKKISKYSGRNFGQTVGAETAAGMSKAPLLHAVCSKLHVRLVRHAGFDFESSEPLGPTDIAEVRGESTSLEIRSRVVAELTAEARKLNDEGEKQTYTSADSGMREQAVVKFNAAVEAAMAIYGPASRQMAEACRTFADVLEMRHAQKGNPMYSKWNHCALVQQDQESLLAAEMYTKAREWHSTKGASLEMARCLTKLAHLSKEHQEESNATPAPQMGEEGVSLDCKCIDRLVAAMDVTESLCSEMHPDTANLYMKLAGAYQDMASPEDASPWLRKAFHVYARLFTIDHQGTKNCWSQLKDVETALNSSLASVPLDRLPEEIAKLDDEEEWSSDEGEYESDDEQA